MVRLQKFLSECGVASRRKAEELITKGKVRVNGSVQRTLGTRIDPKKDIIKVGNKTVRPAHKGVILFHKPRGVVTTLDDPQGRKNISNYLTPRYRSYFPVGRLDWESTGLIILTNDGQLANKLMHPKYKVKRRYEVRVSGSVTKKTIARLKRGVNLKDGPVSAEVDILDSLESSTWLRVSISVGRNRIVRRMMKKVGHPVIKLKRISHGPFRLGKLKVGELRKLTEREYLKIVEKVG